MLWCSYRCVGVCGWLLAYLRGHSIPQTVEQSTALMVLLVVVVVVVEVMVVAMAVGTGADCLCPPPSHPVVQSFFCWQ